MGLIVATDHGAPAAFCSAVMPMVRPVTCALLLREKMYRNAIMSAALERYREEKMLGRAARGSKCRGGIEVRIG